MTKNFTKDELFHIEQQFDTISYQLHRDLVRLTGQFVMAKASVCNTNPEICWGLSNQVKELNRVYDLGKGIRDKCEAQRTRK